MTHPADPFSHRDERTPGYCYKLHAGGYAMDVPFDRTDIDEKAMSVVIPFASGLRRDGVGDLLDVSGIDTSRHRMNPIVLFDHGKKYELPVATAEDPETRAYTVEIDAEAKAARVKAFFYQGKGADTKRKSEHALFCEQLFDLIAKKFIRAGSIGYQVIAAEPMQADYHLGVPQGMHLKRVRMLEASAVVLPANQDTTRKMLSFKSLCGKPVSPHLVKSLADYAVPVTRVVSGYGTKGDFVGETKGLPPPGNEYGHGEKRLKKYVRKFRHHQNAAERTHRDFMAASSGEDLVAKGRASQVARQRRTAAHGEVMDRLANSTARASAKGGTYRGNDQAYEAMDRARNPGSNARKRRKRGDPPAPLNPKGHHANMEDPEYAAIHAEATDPKTPHADRRVSAMARQDLAGDLRHRRGGKALVKGISQEQPMKKGVSEPPTKKGGGYAALRERPKMPFAPEKTQYHPPPTPNARAHTRPDLAGEARDERLAKDRRHWEMADYYFNRNIKKHRKRDKGDDPVKRRMRRLARKANIAPNNPEGGKSLRPGAGPAPPEGGRGRAPGPYEDRLDPYGEKGLKRRARQAGATRRKMPEGDPARRAAERKYDRAQGSSMDRDAELYRTRNGRSQAYDARNTAYVGARKRRKETPERYKPVTPFAPKGHHNYLKDRDYADAHAGAVFDPEVARKHRKVSAMARWDRGQELRDYKALPDEEEDDYVHGHPVGRRVSNPTGDSSRGGNTPRSKKSLSDIRRKYLGEIGEKKLKKHARRAGAGGPLSPAAGKYSHADSESNTRQRWTQPDLSESHHEAKDAIGDGVRLRQRVNGRNIRKQKHAERGKEQGRLPKGHQHGMNHPDPAKRREYQSLHAAGDTYAMRDWLIDNPPPGKAMSAYNAATGGALVGSKHPDEPGEVGNKREKRLKKDARRAVALARKAPDTAAARNAELRYRHSDEESYRRHDAWSGGGANEGAADAAMRREAPGGRQNRKTPTKPRYPKGHYHAMRHPDPAKQREYRSIAASGDTNVMRDWIYDNPSKGIDTAATTDRRREPKGQRYLHTTMKRKGQKSIDIESVVGDNWRQAADIAALTGKLSVLIETVGGRAV